VSAEQLGSINCCVMIAYWGKQIVKLRGNNLKTVLNYG